MRFRGRAGRLGVVVAALVMRATVAAATGATEAQEGEVVVLITDHREAIDDFASLVVTAQGARLHLRGQVPEEGWTVIEAPRQEVDLTRYRDGATFELVRAPVAAGRYDAADLVLAGAARGVVLAGEDQVAVPLEISPARVAVEVRPDQVTHLTFDLVVHDLRDHPGKTWGVLLDEVRVATVDRAAHDGQAGHDDAAHDRAMHDHETTREVTPGAAVPTVAIQVHRDAMNG